MLWVRQLSVCLAACTLLLTGCSAKSKPNGSLPPLAAPSWRDELPVNGFEPASVALPLGATSARPIVVVVHGEGDRPEWQCGSFRGLLGGKVFIVCPRGVRLGQSELYGLGSFDDRIAELRASLAALKSRFGGHVAKTPVVLVGYDAGASLAAELLRQEPSFFSRVLLVNPAPSAMTPSAAKIFVERGGKRILFFCTSAACADDSAQRSLWITRGGGLAKVSQRSVGPFLDPPFIEALRGEMPWLLDGDTRFTAARR